MKQVVLGAVSTFVGCGLKRWFSWGTCQKCAVSGPRGRPRNLNFNQGSRRCCWPVVSTTGLTDSSPTPPERWGFGLCLESVLDPGYNVWIKWVPLSGCLPVVSMTLVKMPSGVRMLGTVHSKGASLIMLYDNRAGTFLCNYSPYVLFST